MHSCVRPLIALALAALAGPALAGCLAAAGNPVVPPSGPVPDPAPLALDAWTRGFEMPVGVTWWPARPESAFVIENVGRLAFIPDTGDSTNRSVALDVTGDVARGLEQGLLALAFHPDPDEDPRAYVSRVDEEGALVVSRYAAPDPVTGALDADSEEVLFRIPQPFETHNGGHISFGPDGYLWIAAGDGGGAVIDNVQNRLSLFGKMLRVDVAGHDEGYGIPEDNPFAKGNGRREVWLMGVRNPWRFAFDHDKDILYLPDVGSERAEEVNVLRVNGDAGVNLGWPAFEGGLARETWRYPTIGHHPPVVAYPHADGNCAVVGGHPYRGDAMPELQGAYVFTDYCSGRVWALRASDPGDVAVAPLYHAGTFVTAIAEDADGELYLVEASGTIHRIVPGDGALPDAIARR